jgi:diguanylate cyclase (GGDEF)-like protein
MLESGRLQQRKNRRGPARWLFGRAPAAGAAPRDIPPADVQLLEGIASATTNEYHFRGELEREFQAYVRHATRTARISLSLLTSVLFVFSQAWIPAALGQPAAMVAPMQVIGIAVLGPLFAAVCWVQARCIQHEFSEWVLLAAFVVEVLCLEVILRLADQVGYRLEPSFAVLVPLAVIVLARLRIARCLYFVLLYFLIIGLYARLAPLRINMRLPSAWLLEILLLGLALLSAAWSKLSFRRQWAANLLLELMAYRDSLTGLPNRRALDDHYDAIRQERAAGGPRQAVFALIDLDHFKQINDTYGHEYGDGVLAEIGLTLAQYASRPQDLAARVGGEEFALILHDCNAASGRARLEIVLHGIRSLGIEHKSQEAGVVTCSIGAAAIDPARPFQDAFRAADECLYRAKSAGRDRLEMVNIN